MEEQPATRTCTACNQDFPLDRFPRHSYGHRYKCKACTNHAKYTPVPKFNCDYTFIDELQDVVDKNRDAIFETLLGLLSPVEDSVDEPADSPMDIQTPTNETEPVDQTPTLPDPHIQ